MASCTPRCRAFWWGKSGVLELSPSSLATFRFCARKFFFATVERRPPAQHIFQPELEVGRVVHEAITNFYLKSPKAASIESHFLQKLAELRNKLGTGYPFWEERVRTMARHFGELPESQRLPLYVEKRLRAPLSSEVTLVGRLDRLDGEGEALVITDYKTGKVRPHRNDLQLPIYAFLVRTLFRRPVAKVRFVYLLEGRVFEKKPQLNRDLVAVRELVQRVQGEVRFLPNPSRRCRFCEYLPCCSEGREFLKGEADELQC